jgi:peptidyl-prolyl cis-trans isomerase SurA
MALAKLDEGEMSSFPGRDGGLRVVMLCGRVSDAPLEGREALGQQLLDQRLQGYADNYLEELRADAVIERP